MTKTIWNDWVLNKSYDDSNIEFSKEGVAVNLNGQWELKKARFHLPEHWADEFKAEQAAKKSGLPAPAAGADKFTAQKQHLNGLFDNIHKDPANRATHIENVKKYVGALPAGSLDVGHLGNLVEKTRGAKQPGGHGKTQRMGSGKMISHKELGEMITPHVREANDLKDIHENNGGDDAMRTLMRVHGTNGDSTIGYGGDSPVFNKPKNHGDLVDLVNPGKGSNGLMDFSDPNGSGVQHTHQSDHLNSDWDEKLHNNVVSTWDDLMGDDDGWSNDKKVKDHEDAVVERGLEHFKKHHKLK